MPIAMLRVRTQHSCVAPRRPIPLDELDHRLLESLQEDAERTLRQLGNAVGLSPSAVQRRITRYRTAGLIARQIAVLDPEVMAGTVLAAVLVTLERESTKEHRTFQSRMRAAPEVQQCYSLAGERDYLVMVVAGGTADCRDVVDRLFMDDSNVKRYTTHLVFNAVKLGLSVPTKCPG